VHRLVEVLDFINQGGRIEGLLLQEVHRVEGSNNQRLFVNAARSACKNPLEILEFASESSGREEP
jgi:hypothetical protein